MDVYILQEVFQDVRYNISVYLDPKKLDAARKAAREEHPDRVYTWERFTVKEDE